MRITTSAISLELKKKSKSRLTAMVILNGINYFVFRFPFAIVKFYVLIFRHDEIEKKFLPNFIKEWIAVKFGKDYFPNI